jgi:hypothetical protein
MCSVNAVREHRMSHISVRMHENNAALTAIPMVYWSSNTKRLLEFSAQHLSILSMDLKIDGKQPFSQLVYMIATKLQRLNSCSLGLATRLKYYGNCLDL